MMEKLLNGCMLGSCNPFLYSFLFCSPPTPIKVVLCSSELVYCQKDGRSSTEHSVVFPIPWGVLDEVGIQAALVVSRSGASIIVLQINFFKAIFILILMLPKSLKVCTKESHCLDVNNKYQQNFRPKTRKLL